MRRAFTLIELMVVCVVLVLVASLALPNVVGMKKARDRTEAYDAVLRLAQAARETAIQSGRTYTLTLNGSMVEVNRDDDTQLSRDGTNGTTTPYVTASTSTATTGSGVARLPRGFAFDGKGQSLPATGASTNASDPDGAGTSFPDGVSVGNATLDGKSATGSDFTLHFFPDGRSEGGGFEMQDGSATKSLQIDRNGFATLQDGSLPVTGENNWEAGTYAQRTSTTGS